MNAASFALLVAGAAICAVTPVILLTVRWSRKRTTKLNRWADIYGLERQPGESNRQLELRVMDRAMKLLGSSLRGPHRRRR